MSIKLYLRKKDNTYDITNILEKVTWSGDFKSVARKLDFSILTRVVDISINEGDLVSYYVDKDKVFEGIIWEYSSSSGGDSLSVLAYDNGIYLLKNKLAYNFKNTKAESIAKKVADDLGISIGNIVNTGIDVTKLFLGVSAYEIIMTAYTEASKKTGKKYMCYIKDNKLYVEEKGKIKLNISFEEGKNLIESNARVTLENMINKVIIVDEKGNKKEEIKNDEWIKLYGSIQDVVESGEDKDVMSEAKSKLKGVEKTFSLNGYGDISCITGYGVEVKDSYTNMKGLFYIDTDSHSWEDGEYKIDLEISLQNIMHEVNSGQEESETSNDVSTTVTGGKEVDAEFTAYYPSNDPMQGGYKAANGETLKPSSLTCAAPKEVAFNTKIQVKGTGTSRDGVVYRTNDRGSAIKIVNGVYKIDLLMATKKEAYSFGRRRGKAVIGVEATQGSSDKSTSDKANKAIELAKAKVGKPYVWGATGPNSFDCSGLTSWCYKQVGISIPRTSKEQSRYGKSVSKSNLQPGDLLFFSTNGTGQVSHVGMYIGGGKMVHAANPKKGVRYDDINSSYYSKTFTNARRVV